MQLVKLNANNGTKLATFQGLTPTKIEGRLCYSAYSYGDRAWRKKNKPYPRVSGCAAQYHQLILAACFCQTKMLSLPPCIDCVLPSCLCFQLFQQLLHVKDQQCALTQCAASIRFASLQLSQNCPRKFSDPAPFQGPVDSPTVKSLNSGSFVLNFNEEDEVPTATWFAMIWVSAVLPASSTAAHTFSAACVCCTPRGLPEPVV